MKCFLFTIYSNTFHEAGSTRTTFYPVSIYSNTLSFVSGTHNNIVTKPIG